MPFIVNSHEEYTRSLEKLYRHLVKRVFDEFGIDITIEWEDRVMAGEYDVPLPRK
jgi:UDP-N-acetylenolpyruvoylglucosamine reductase